MLSQRVLHVLFTYDPQTGHLFWTKPSKSHKKRQGRIDHNALGYLRASIFGETYKVEKLVWQYHYGYYPEKILDHLNGKPNDNRIENLREVSSAENSRNRSLNKNNSSGIHGVYFNIKDNIWFVSISYNKKRHYLGGTKDLLEAAYLRYTAEKCLDWDSYKHRSTAYQYIQSYEEASRNLKCLKN